MSRPDSGKEDVLQDVFRGGVLQVLMDAARHNFLQEPASYNFLWKVRTERSVGDGDQLLPRGTANRAPEKMTRPDPKWGLTARRGGDRFTEISTDFPGDQYGLARSRSGPRLGWHCPLDAGGDRISIALAIGEVAARTT
jgi:hypothetical protein